MNAHSIYRKPSKAAGKARSKMTKNLGSIYFDWGYCPTEDEIDEMTDIRKDLLEDGTKDVNSLRFKMKLDNDEDTDATTKNAIRRIFYPTAKEHKSVFLKSGPVQLYESDSENELDSPPSSAARQEFRNFIHKKSKQDLMLFSRGIVFSSSVQPEVQATNKKNLFSTRISFSQKKCGMSFIQPQNSNLTTSDSGKEKVKHAFLFSDLDRIETLDVWKPKDFKTYLNGDNEVFLFGRSFALFILKRREPIIVVCPGKEDVDTWIDAFRVCISGQKSKALGRNRASVVREGIVFGINNTNRVRSSLSFKESCVDWGDDEYDDYEDD